MFFYLMDLDFILIYNIRKYFGKPYGQGQQLFAWMFGHPPSKPSSPENVPSLYNVY
jgi:hypothetical protein